MKGTRTGRSASVSAAEARLLLGVGLIVLTLLLIAAVGGRSSRWTRFGANGHLWDWLHLLLLPVVLALLPTMRRLHLARFGRAWAVSRLAAAAAALTLAIGGYAVPWKWTGFTGSTFWDWLELLFVPFALPVAVTLLAHGAARSVRAEG